MKTLVMLGAAVLMSSQHIACLAQTPKSWSVPRTPWGDPDIQGRWPANDMQGTPYERPESFGTRATLNDKEFAERQATRERQVRADGEVYVPQGQRTGIGGPSHWSAGERGNPQRQASLVVDPPNGRIPPMTEEGKKLFALARAAPTTTTSPMPWSRIRSRRSKISVRTIAASRAACSRRCCRPRTTWARRSCRSRAQW